jgi:hypothetical protein
LSLRRILALAAAAALAALFWFALFRFQESPGARTGRSPDVRPVTAPGGPPAPSPAPSPAAPPADPYATDAPSHLADRLNDPGGDIHADLRILDDIFQQYRSALHSDDPVGDNIDITAALTGHNRIGFAFIPPNSPAINARGEICDRWGTPFFFHQLSGSQMEIRSAGPDRTLWTPDDEVLTPGLHPPKL